MEGHKNGVSSLAFSPDGTRLVSLGEGGMFAPAETRLWEMPSARPIADFVWPKQVARAVAFRPDGHQFALAMYDEVAPNDAVRRMPAKRVSVVTLHDTRDGQIQRTLRLDQLITDLTYSPDGHRVAVAGYAGVTGSTLGGEGGAQAAREYDLESDTWRDLVPARSRGPLELAYSPDDQRLVTGNLGTVTVWDLGSRRELLTLGNLRGPHVAFSRDGSRLLAVSVGDKTVTVWDGTPKK